MWKSRQSSYEQFRYGAPSPVTLAPLLNSQKREHVIHKLMDILDGWRSSAFEHEGECRAGMRSAFCLQGHSWQRSDDEAVRMTREALHRNRAVRPTWDQGQPEYVNCENECAWCGGIVPKVLQRGGRMRHMSYCSGRCARSAIRHRGLYRVDQEHDTRALLDARDIIHREAHETRACACCQDLFKPRFRTGRYCSAECTAKARRTRPTLNCLHCQAGFVSKPSHGGMARFCSVDCKRAHGVTPQHACRCQACGSAFRAKLARAKFCSKECKFFWTNNVAKGKLPKAIGPRLFDFIFIVSAPERSNVVHLTPAVFDEWFREAA